MNEEISLYIHIPFCISKCAYCDFFSRPEGKKNSINDKAIIPDTYVSALCKEIQFRIEKHQVKKLKTLYIGGGTPSLLTSEQFKTLFKQLKSYTELSLQTEITVEVNPDDVNLKLLETLSDCGVNRISCGIQSMNDRALKTACRRADSQINKNALSLLHKYWKGQLSLDLISGLPGDNEDTLLASLKEVCEINPEHVSLYSLTIEDETPFGKQLDSGALKYDFDQADRLWLKGCAFLESRAYKWYEVSNFCREGKECKHNLAYWTHSSYLGCGSGGTGSLYSAGGRGFRWTNTQNIEDYINFWNDFSENKELKLCDVQNEEEIDFETSRFEFFMMSLRKIRGFKLSEYKNIFSQELPGKFIEVFDRWEEKGLCKKQELLSDFSDTEYAMTEKGLLYLNRFLEELF